MNLAEIKKQLIQELSVIKNTADLEQLRIIYLGRKGKLTSILRSLKDLPEKERKKIGKEANELKKEIEIIISERKSEVLEKEFKTKEKKIDVTVPGIKALQGHLHPLTLISRKIEETFQSMGFKILEGPDIETEYYNFDALNIPKDHPARDAWDTFWLKQKSKSPKVKNQKLLLRTHTSPMQIRFMEKNNPPLRVVVPGRVFRYEATDASHSHTFYQLEGLMVDRNINIGNFKAVVEEFLRRIFGRETETRIRPSYFPFVEPGFEVDMRQPSGEWLEIMGAGMVHPNVFKAVGYVPSNWQGFAFGVGIDRIAKLKYKINDIRLLYSGDLKFLNQF
jgi:phenylalanyl-tRNA synthetase alpha chain